MAETADLPTFINWLLEGTTQEQGPYTLVPESYMLARNAVPPKTSQHDQLADAFQVVLTTAATLNLTGWTIRTDGVDRVDTPD